MWMMVMAGAVWFFALVVVHFFQKKIWVVMGWGSIFFMALWAAFQKWVDPLTWIFMLLLSALTFWVGGIFKSWVWAACKTLDEEILLSRDKLDALTQTLKKKTRETDETNQKANGIYTVYDKIKEMSQSLDKLEVFLVFGQALLSQSQFQSLTLAFFDEDGNDSRIPQEITRLDRSDFEGLFDKSFVLKNKTKYETGATPFLCKVFETVFQTREPVHVTDAEEGPSVATPIFINKKLFSVLVISGIGSEVFPALPILTERFVAEIERVRLYEKVETLAITDGLTGVHVRRHLMERLEAEINRSRKFGFDLSFLMIDVDHFKRFNDRYGHLVGDVVLKQTAETIKKNIRELDLVGRYGGEEFGVLLVETSRSGASFVAKRIRSAVEQKNYKAYNENLNATVSIGCVTFPKGQAGADLVLDVADQALYEAKRRGRNRVCVVDPQGIIAE